LPACDHQTYWPKVDALRARLLAMAPAQISNAGRLASGVEISARIESVIAALNGEADTSGPQAALFEPESATEVLYRCQRLEPLIEDVAQRFAATHATGDLETSTCVQDSKAVHEALEEFDRRATRLLASNPSGVNEDTAPPLPQGLLTDMRARLSSRLLSIVDTLAKGRKQQAAAQRRSLVDNLPAGQHRCVNAMEKLIQDASSSLQQTTALAKREFAEIQVMFNEHRNRVAGHRKRQADADADLTSSIKRLEERWDVRLQEETADRSSFERTQQSKSSSTFSQLQADARCLSAVPDPEQLAAQLSDVQQAIETGRVQRHEAIAKAGQGIESALQRLRSGIDKEAGALLELRECTTQRLQESVRELTLHLEEERCERRDRLNALAEVVDRMRESLEKSAESAHAPWIGGMPRTPMLSDVKPSQLQLRKPEFNVQLTGKAMHYDDECSTVSSQSYASAVCANKKEHVLFRREVSP
jgi:hypothetical protein